MDTSTGFLVQQLGREGDEASRRHEESLAFLLLSAAQKIQDLSSRVAELQAKPPEQP